MVEAMLCTISVLLNTPSGIVLIKDKRKPQPHFWKLLGGKGRVSRHVPPERLAVSKIFTKTGILLDEKDLTLTKKENRDGHVFFCFCVRLDTTPPLRERPEIEVLGIFSHAEILCMEDFFGPHVPLVRMVGSETIVNDNDDEADRWENEGGTIG